MVDMRPSLLLTLRGPVLAFNILSDVGWCQGRLVPTLATIAAMVTDVCVARYIRKTGRPLFAPRIAVDFLIVVLGAVAIPVHWPYSGVLWLLIPVTVDLAISLNVSAAGLFVTCAGATIYGIRWVGGGDSYIGDLAFHVTWLLGVLAAAFWVISAAASRYRLDEVLERAAFTHLLRLDVRNQVLLGAGGTITEALNRAWYQLELSVGARASAGRHLFRSQQDDLARSTRESGIYLADVLQQAASAQRQDRARVAEHLHLSIDRIAGVQVLTARQSAALLTFVKSSGLQGLHAVQVVNKHLASGQISLRIGSEHISVPPALEREIDFTPIAVVLGAATVLELGNPVYANLEGAPVGLLAGLTFVSGWLGIHLRRQDSKRAGTTLAICVLLPAVGSLLLAELGSTNWRILETRVLVPSLAGLSASLYIIAGAWRVFHPKTRAATCTVLGMSLAYGVVQNPFGPPSLAYIVGELCFPFSAILTGKAIDRAVTSVRLAKKAELLTAMHVTESEWRREAWLGELDRFGQEIRNIEPLIPPVRDEHSLRAQADIYEARASLAALRVSGPS